MRIDGSCHCRNISYALDWTPEPSEIPARACTCSFCVKHGAVWTACPDATIKVTVTQPDRVSTYAFETRTADFHICSICGVAPLVTSRIDGRTYAVVNVNTFDDIDTALLRRAPVSFDGEENDARLARRKTKWIGHVEFISPGAA